MYEALTILIRYAMIAFSTYLVTTTDLDQSMVEPLAALAVALFAVLWMIKVRFKKWLGYNTENTDEEKG